MSGWLMVLLAVPALAAISNLQVVGVTNVQAVLSYQAPSGDSCTVEVSENPGFTPLAHDVNPELFAGENADSRKSAVADGTTRFFVIGRRAVEQAADGKWYSRALQADTPHYFRVRCGGDSASGLFRTATVPVGVTTPWPIPQDPKTGDFRWPSVDGDDHNQTVIDPNYGTLIRRVLAPGDIDSLIFDKKKFGKAAGAGWNNPQASLADDQAAATNAGGTGWLALTEADIRFTEIYDTSSGIDSVVVRVKGSATGTSEAARTIEACLTLDGSACFSDLRRVALDTRESQKTLGSGVRIDTWGPPLWGQDVGRNRSFGVLIRAAQAGAQVSIQAVEIDLVMSEAAGFPDAGNFRTCAPLKSNGGFHCSYPGAGGSGANYMFWIAPETGEVRLLGKILARGWGGPNTQCLSNNALWDFEDPNIYYCTASENGKQVLLKGTYTGGDAPGARNAAAPMTWENLTPGANTIGQLMKAFDPSFDADSFGCGLANLVGKYAVFHCLRGGQNSIAWMGVLDLGNRRPLGQGGTARLVAAVKEFAAPNTRWCTHHAVEPLIGVNLVGWTPQFLRGGGAGQEPRTIKLQSSLPAAAGTFTLQTGGEPAPYLMDALPGDYFQIPGPVYDFLRIVRKNSATEWVVERKVLGAPAAVASGATASAFCSAYVSDDPTVAPTVYWDFLADPRAQDAANKTWVVEKVLTGDHIVQRGNYRLQGNWFDGYQVVTPGLPASSNQKPSFLIPSNPKWGDTRPWQGLNEPAQGMEAYQSHPSYENYAASGPGRNNWFVDLIPFVGFRRLLSSVTPVPGTTQVYKGNGVTIHREAFPTLANCGGRQLKDISPGPITDRDTYTYCVGPGCVNGGAAADVYVSCPAPVSKDSFCNYRFSGSDSYVCVSDLPAYGQSISQFYFDPSGRRARVLTNALMALHATRTVGILDTASPLPDGSWVVFAAYANNARKDLFMVKVPSEPAPEDTQTGKPVAVTVNGAPPEGATQARLEYGATASLGSTTAPAACSSDGCSLVLAARPGEVLYTRVTYLDSTGRVVAQGPIQPRISSGVAGSGLPKPSVAQAVNAASADQALAPGGLVSLLGDNLATCTAQAEPGPWPASLCNASAAFNGLPGFFFSASPTQLNVLLPSRVSPGQSLEVVASREGLASDPLTIPASGLRETAPAIYSYALPGDLTPRAIVQLQDGMLNGPLSTDPNRRPMRRGEPGVMYVNSMGPTSPSVNDGEPAPTDPPAQTTKPVSLLVNDLPQEVLYSGLSPSLVGMYQVNFILHPATEVKAGDNNRIWLQMDGADSPRLVLSIEP